MKLEAHLKIIMRNVIKRSFSNVPKPSQLKDVEARAKKVKMLKVKNQGNIVNIGMRSTKLLLAQTKLNKCERLRAMPLQSGPMLNVLSSQ